MIRPRILIINPNSSLETTEVIDTAAQNFAGDIADIKTLSIGAAPPFIGCFRDRAEIALPIMKIVEENQKEYDAFIDACHADPCLDLLKEVSSKPVIGIAEASMKTATMLGRRFSIVTPVKRGIPNKKILIEKYGLTRFLSSIRAVDQEEAPSEKGKLLSAALRAVREDEAEVLVLGCAEYALEGRLLSRDIGAPILEGVSCALSIAIGLLRYEMTLDRKEVF